MTHPLLFDRDLLHFRCGRAKGLSYLKENFMPTRLNPGSAVSFALAALIIAGCGANPRPVAGPPPSGTLAKDVASTQVGPASTAEVEVSNPESDIESSEPLASTLGDRPVPDTQQSASAIQIGQSKASEEQSPAASPLRPTVEKPSVEQPTSEELSQWDIPDYSPLQLLACYDDFSDSLVQALAVSPDGAKFAIAGERLTIWNMGDTKPAIDLLEAIATDQIERPIRSLAISPDGKLLAAGDQSGRLIVWDLEDLKQVYSIAAHEGRLLQIAFSPSSQQLATSSYSGEVRLWKARDGERIKSLIVSNFEPTRLVFVSEQSLACSGDDVSLWNLDSGQQSTVLTTGYAPARALALSANKQQLVFGEKDGALKIWDILANGIATGPSLLGSASDIAFSNDNLRVAADAPDRTLRIWDLATRRTVQVIDADGGRTVDLAWIPGTQVLLVATEEGRVRLWGTPQAAASLGLPPIQSAVFEPAAIGSQRPMSSGQVTTVIDLRSFPQLPGAVPQWGDIQNSSYVADATPAEAEKFYRYALHQAGWTEEASQQPTLLTFQKQGCWLSISISPATDPNAGEAGKLQISIQFAGNYDMRWLPKFAAIESKSNFDNFGFSAYEFDGDGGRAIETISWPWLDSLFAAGFKLN